MVAPAGLMHPTLAAEPPDGTGWIFEIKWDGVRALLLRHGGEARLIGRSGRDVTSTYPEIAAAVARLGGGDVVLDAEVVALDADGRPSFHRLQHRMHDRTPTPASQRATPASALVFDALAIGGRDLRGRPLLERKALLRRLLRRPGVLRYVDHVRGRGRDFLAALAASNLEGLVAKRAQSRYVVGRSRDWIKVKCTRTGTFVIGGYTVPQGTRAHLGALHLGRRDGRELAYVGRVGSGLDDTMLEHLAVRLGKLAIPRRPFTSGDPPLGGEHHWVRPRLSCSVRFTEWTDDGRLRHPVFLGLA